MNYELEEGIETGVVGRFESTLGDTHCKVATFFSYYSIPLYRQIQGIVGNSRELFRTDGELFANLCRLQNLICVETIHMLKVLNSNKYYATMVLLYLN